MITRTTQSSYANLMTFQLGRISTDLFDVQEEAYTGLSVNRPSDSPSDVSLILSLRASIADQAIYEDNAGRSILYSSTADAALDEVTNDLTRALEIATQMASETYNEDDRASAAMEVEALYEEMVRLANTEVNGHYIFAGTAYGSAAYDDAGNYLGSTDEPSTSVGTASNAATGYDGSEIFEGDEDIFAVLEELAAALNSNDPEAVQATMDRINTSVSQVITARQQVGLDMTAAEDALILSESMAVSLNAMLAEVAGIDETETYSRLAQVQMAYETALSVASTGLGMNLFSMI